MGVTTGADLHVSASGRGRPRRLVRGTAAALAVAAFLSACSSSSEPRSSASEVCGRIVNAPPGGGVRASGATQVVHSSRDRLTLYDVSSDTLSTLRADVRSPLGLRPRFRAPALISFADVRERPDDALPFGRDSLFLMNMESRKTTEILRLPGDLRGYDWTSDGTRLAYQVNLAPSAALCLYDASAGTIALLRRMNEAVTSHRMQDDEQSVAWSRNDASILVVDTYQTPSVLLLDEAGRDLVPPRDGTFASWMPDEKTVLFREAREPDASPRWMLLDVESGRARPSKIPAGTFRPAISPDGTLIAYDDGDVDSPSIHVFDLRTNEARPLVQGYAAPVWLGPDLIAATRAGPCPPTTEPRTECNGWWTRLNPAVGVRLDGESNPLALPSTMNADLSLVHALVG